MPMISIDSDQSEQSVLSIVTLFTYNIHMCRCFLLSEAYNHLVAIVLVKQYHVPGIIPIMVVCCVGNSFPAVADIF